MEFGVKVLGKRNGGVRFRVWVRSLGVGVEGLGFEFQSLEFRSQGSGLRG